MSETNTTTTTTTEARKAPKGKGKTQEPKTQFGVERAHDLPWHDKKVKVFKVLRALGATDGANSAPASKIAKKAGLTARDVRHYCYHAKAAKLVGVAEDVEGIAGYGFFLTAKGQEIDPVAAQKAERAASKE